MKKTIFAISIIAVAVIFFLIGYFIGQTPVLDKEEIAQKTKEEIEQKLIEGHVINPEPQEIFSLSGNVINVGNDYLVLSPSIRQDPFADLFPQQVKILVNENTKIEKWTLKSPSEYEQGKNQDSDPYKKVPAQLNEINSNYYIILANSATNIKGLNQFTATEIDFSSENPLIEK